MCGDLADCLMLGSELQWRISRRRGGRSDNAVQAPGNEEGEVVVEVVEEEEKEDLVVGISLSDADGDWAGKGGEVEHDLGNSTETRSPQPAACSPHSDGKERPRQAPLACLQASSALTSLALPSPPLRYSCPSVRPLPSLLPLPLPPALTWTQD